MAKAFSSTVGVILSATENIYEPIRCLKTSNRTNISTFVKNGLPSDKKDQILIRLLIVF
jgi:hypothetical protein